MVIGQHKYCGNSPMSVNAEFKVSAPPFRWDESGGIRIGQSRVTLDSLLAAYHSGFTPEEIAFQYSVLHLEEIYSAIAYYLNHRQEIDNYIDQRRQKAQQQRSEFVQQYNLADLRQRLSDRYQTQGELKGDASIS
jgi:uncharacterized protein (DUF433 family)